MLDIISFNYGKKIITVQDSLIACIPKRGGKKH